jgi:3-hydroxybutyryl-CoA dehydratase
MCKQCDTKVGNRYAFDLPTNLRPLVDLARRACNDSARFSVDDRSQMVAGGIAVVGSEEPTYADIVFEQSLFSDLPHAQSLTAVSANLNASTDPTRRQVRYLAFETRDDSWPDSELFQALVPLDKTQPTATILRIMHKTGCVQFWKLSEVLEHFQIAATVAATTAAVESASVQHPVSASAPTTTNWNVGDTRSNSRVIDAAVVHAVAMVSGDQQRIHTDPEFAAKSMFGAQIAHGVILLMLTSAVLGMKMPGEGTILQKMEMELKAPVFFDDTITITATINEIAGKKMKIGITCTNQHGVVVGEGTQSVSYKRPD